MNGAKLLASSAMLSLLLMFYRRTIPLHICMTQVPHYTVNENGDREVRVIAVPECQTCTWVALFQMVLELMHCLYVSFECATNVLPDYVHMRKMVFCLSDDSLNRVCLSKLLRKKGDNQHSLLKSCFLVV